MFAKEIFEKLNAVNEKRNGWNVIYAVYMPRHFIAHIGIFVSIVLHLVSFFSFSRIFLLDALYYRQLPVSHFDHRCFVLFWFNFVWISLYALLSHCQPISKCLSAFCLRLVLCYFDSNVPKSAHRVWTTSTGQYLPVADGIPFALSVVWYLPFFSLFIHSVKAQPMLPFVSMTAHFLPFDSATQKQFSCCYHVII